MHKMIKYLKPFWLLLVLAIALLYAQAQADLALPDYMSRIVNVGIQQSGFEEVIPEVLSQGDYLMIASTIEEGFQQAFIDAYREIGPLDGLVYEMYSETFKLLEGQSFFALRDSDEGLRELDPLLRQAIVDVFVAIAKTKMPESTMLDEGFSDQVAIQVTRTLYTQYGYDLAKHQQSYILSIGGWMLLVTLIGAFCAIGVGFLAARIAAGFGRNMRNTLFSKIEQFSLHELDSFSTASLITRTTNDIMQIQNLLVMLIRMMFYAPLMGIGGVIRALNKSASMSWIIALAVIVLLGLIMLVFSIAMPKFKMVQKVVDRLNLVTREKLSGMLVIRAFNTQKHEEQRFDAVNTELTQLNLFVNRVMVIMFPMMMLIMNVVTLTIVWVGAHQIAQAQMQVGDMMAFMQYALQIIMAFLMLSMVFIMIPRASVSALRIAEVLEMPLSIIDPLIPTVAKESSERLTHAVGVTFKNLTFKYPNAQEAMLKEIDLEFPVGKTTAIIGSTGSGKTTLINMIPRFYEATKGAVLVNGIDVRDYAQEALRDMIGYVPQKANLFSGTVRENIAYGQKDSSDAAVMEALETAQARDFVEAMEDGLEAAIAQGGASVSGGQRQRLAIARALIKRPPVLIFDDSFSALDYKTDRMLRNALKEKLKDTTVIIVAQRIATIRHADQIVVMEDGCIVGCASHDVLMKTCETYREIAQSQLTKEELA